MRRACSCHPFPSPHRVRSVCRFRVWSLVAGLDFGELRAGLSSLYVTELLFVVGADHSVSCFVIARALCLLQRPPSTPHRVRSIRGCLGCSSWSDVASDLVRRFSAGALALVAFRGCLRKVADGPGHFRRLLCFKSPFAYWAQVHCACAWW